MFMFSNLDGGGVRASLMGAIFDEERDALAECVASAGEGPIDLWLNSPGGDLSSAFAMRSVLSEYPGQITIHCSGVVASAATVLLCAKDVRVVGHRGSVFMMHSPSAWSEGTSEDMKKAAEALDVITDELVQVYAQRLSVDEKAIRAMLKKESWLSLEKAAALGLVDEVEAPIATVSEPTVSESAPADPFSAEALDAISEKVSNRVAASLSAGLLTEDSAKTRFDETVSLVSSLSDRIVALEKVAAETAGGLKKVSEGVSRAYALDYGALPVNTYHDNQTTQNSGFKLNSSRGH